MRLSRTDVLPMLVIIAGGAVGVLTTGTLSSGPGSVPPPGPVAVPVTTERSSTPMVRVGGVSADGFLLVPVGAVVQVEELLRQQREMLRDVRGLPEEQVARTDLIDQLSEKKERMHEAVQTLERELDSFASGGWPDEPEAGVAVSGVANLIRESKLKDKLQYSRGTIEQWDVGSAVTLEMSIEEDLRRLLDQMERAPLVYVEGLRIDMNGGTSAMWKRVVRGEQRGIPVSVLRSTIDSWSEATNTPASVIGGIESLEIMSTNAAIAVYGDEALGGVIQIFVKD